MRMFRIFHKECFWVCLVILLFGVFKDVVNTGGKKLTVWLLLSFNIIFTLFALRKFKSLEKCQILH